MQASDPLQLKVWRTLATQWLIPRLGQFYSDYPYIEVRIEPTGVPVDFSREPFTAAIQYGEGKWEGCTGRLLFSEVLQPVCSPEFLEKHGHEIKTEADLVKFRLLATKLKVDDWKYWFEAQGYYVPGVDPMDFPTSNMCYQAAASSIGIAMGQAILLTNFLREGKLVQLFNGVSRAERGYYLIWPNSISPSSKLKSFTHWITKAAGAMDTMNDDLQEAASRKFVQPSENGRAGSLRFPGMQKS